jgi:hypothetical protein
MGDRDAFITHQGKEILLVDFTSLKGDQFIQAVGEAKKFLMNTGKKDLLVLYDVSHSRVSPEAVDTLKEAAKATHPFIKRRAVVGITGLQRVFLNAVNVFTGEDIKPFDNIEQAKDWLAS